MAACAATAVVPAPAGGQPAAPDVGRQIRPSFRFESVGEGRGIGPYAMAFGFGAGVAAADYDNDGDIDLFVPNASGAPNQLYRNDGSGVFTEVGLGSGVGSLIPARVGLFADFNADGRPDLVVAHDEAGGGSIFRSLSLYTQNADATFTDQTIASGLHLLLTSSPAHHVGGMAAGDLNGDGWLDLVVTYWGAGLHILFNDGDATFTRVEQGLWPGFYWQPIIFDLDRDGAAEIHACVDFGPNRVLKRSSGGSFVDVAPGAGLDRAWNEMGASMGDIDNDADLDIYCTNIAREGPGGFTHNVLLRNDSAGPLLAFSEIAQLAGAAFGGYGWGNTFFDADNDGRLDLCEVNQTENPSVASRLFWNAGSGPTGDTKFLDVASQAGFAYHDYGSCVVALDMDRDGDLDLAQTVRQGPLRVLENTPAAASPPRSWLVVRPRTTGPNTRAIGALVRVVAGGRERIRPITCGTSFMGQEPAEAHFGLGGATAVDSVVIEWPGGGTTVLTGVAPNQVLDVLRP